MLYKVYANNVKKVHPVMKASNVSICKAIDENVDHIMENLQIENEEAFTVIYDKLYNAFKKKFEVNKCISVGDYMIIESDDVPSRPNICNWEVL